MRRQANSTQRAWCRRGALTPRAIATQASRGGGTPPTKASRPERAFTLLELLVVVGLIATLSFFLLSGLVGGGKSATLQSAQALLANLVTSARTSSMASGQSSRILVQVDPGSESRRYLRYVVVQTQSSAGWQTSIETYLPDGVYVVPGNFSSLPAGLFASDTAVPWTKTDGTPLRSTALRANQVTTETVNYPGAEQWVALTISASAGTVQSGDIILASGRVRPPGSYAAGESPVELVNPETVRGLTLSAYAVPVLINERSGF